MAAFFTISSSSACSANNRLSLAPSVVSSLSLSLIFATFLTAYATHKFERISDSCRAAATPTFSANLSVSALNSGVCLIRVFLVVIVHFVSDCIHLTQCPKLLGQITHPSATKQRQAPSFGEIGSPRVGRI